MISMVLLLPFWLCVGWMASAVEPVRVGPGFRQATIADRAEILPDPGGDLTLAAVRTPEVEMRFRPSSGLIFFFRPSTSTLWIRFKLDVIDESERFNRLQLSIDTPSLASAELYYPSQDGHYRVIRKGHEHEPAPPAWQSRTPFFQFSDHNGDGDWYYLRVATVEPGHLFTPGFGVRLIEEPLAAVGRTKAVGVLGLLAGVWLLILTINLVVGVRLQDRIYVWALGAVFFFGGYGFLQAGLHYLLGWAGGSRWLSPVLLTAQIFGLALTLDYLGADRSYRWLHRSFQIGIVLGLVCLVAHTVGFERVAEPAGSVVVGVSMAVICLATAIRVRQGFRTALLFWVAWLVISLGLVISGLSGLGTSSIDGSMGYAILMGAVLAAGLWSVALAERRRQCRCERLEQLQQQATAYERQLQDAEAVSTRLSAEHQQLLHILSHDLANPVGSSLVALDLMQTNPALVETFADLLQKSGRNALDVINAVREMTITEPSFARPRLQTYNLLELTRESLEILDFRLKEKGVTALLEIDPTISVKVIKPLFVSSVLNNLITNAVKFSFSGDRIVISAFCFDRQIRIAIEDHGIGIPADLLTGLFIPDPATIRPGTDGEVGTGFGMPLVKALIAMMDGRLEIESKAKRTDAHAPDGHGTTVTLWLTAG
jgi:signal transduction histidine kinase